MKEPNESRMDEGTQGAPAERGGDASAFCDSRCAGAAERRREWVLVSIVLLIGCFLRIALAVVARQEVTGGDDLDYLRRGLFFARGGANDVWRAPVQIWFVGMAMRATNYSFFLTRILLAFLSSGMLLFAYLTARRLLSFRLAFATLVVITAWPEFYPYSILLLSEGICILLLSVAVWATVVALQRPALPGMRSVLGFLVAGAAWGAAALSRDELLFIALSMGLPIYLVLRDWKRTALSFAALVVGVFLVVSPYTARNVIRRHTFAIITNHAAYNFWEHWNGQVGKQVLSKEYWSWPEPERQRRSMEKAFECLKARPGFVFMQGVRSLARMFEVEVYGRNILYLGWLGDPLSPVPKLYFLAVNALLLAALVGFSIGLVLTWRRGEYWVFYLMIAASLFMHAVAFGQGRYRLPWMPFMLLVSVMGWREAVARWRQAREKILAGAILGAAVYAFSLGFMWKEYRGYYTGYREELIKSASIHRLPAEMKTHFLHLATISQQRAAAWQQQEAKPPSR